MEKAREKFAKLAVCIHITPSVINILQIEDCTICFQIVSHRAKKNLRLFGSCHGWQHGRQPRHPGAVVLQE